MRARVHNAGRKPSNWHSQKPQKIRFSKGFLNEFGHLIINKDKTPTYREPSPLSTEEKERIYSFIQSTCRKYDPLDKPEPSQEERDFCSSLAFELAKNRRILEKHKISPEQKIHCLKNYIEYGLFLRSLHGDKFTPVDQTKFFMVLNSQGKLDPQKLAEEIKQIKDEYAHFDSTYDRPIKKTGHKSIPSEMDHLSEYHLHNAHRALKETLTMPQFILELEENNHTYKKPSLEMILPTFEHFAQYKISRRFPHETENPSLLEAAHTSLEEALTKYSVHDCNWDIFLTLCLQHVQWGLHYAYGRENRAEGLDNQPSKIIVSPKKPLLSLPKNIDENSLEYRCLEIARQHLTYTMNDNNIDEKSRSSKIADIHSYYNLLFENLGMTHANNSWTELKLKLDDINEGNKKYSTREVFKTLNINSNPATFNALYKIRDYLSTRSDSGEKGLFITPEGVRILTYHLCDQNALTQNTLRGMAND